MPSMPSGPGFVQIPAENGEMLSLKVTAASEQKMTSGSGTPVCKYDKCKCIGKNYKGAKTGNGAKCTMHKHKEKW